MSTLVYRSFILPWHRLDEDEGRFRKTLSITMVLAIVFSIGIPFIPVPEIDQYKVEKLPPRLAQLLLEKQKPKPVPKKVVKKEEKKK